MKSLYGMKPAFQPRESCRPSVDQPGSLFQQFMLIGTYLAFPDFAREANPYDAWQHARRLVLPHARTKRGTAA